MIQPKRYDLLLSLPLGLMMAGCASLKSPDYGPRTTPSLGDSQLGVVSGRPGEEDLIRSGAINSISGNLDQRRISGRVIDHRGRPISGATVRLADSASAGGQVSDVVTDEAGGFTIRGLRDATPYTLIAMLDLGHESRVARARFLSGETQARILLEPNSESADLNRREQVRYPSARQVRDVDSDLDDQIAQVSTYTGSKNQPPAGRWIYVLEDGTEAELRIDREQDLNESDYQEIKSEKQTKRANAGRLASRVVSQRHEDELVDHRVAKANQIPSHDSMSPNRQSFDGNDSAYIEPAAQEKNGRKTPEESVNSQWRAKRPQTAASHQDTRVTKTQYVNEDGENPLPPAIERKAFIYEEFEEIGSGTRMARTDRADIGSSPRNRALNSHMDDLVPVEPAPRPADEVLAEEMEFPSQNFRRENPERLDLTPQRRDQRPFYADSESAGTLRVEDIEEANRIRRLQRMRDTGQRGDPSLREKPIALQRNLTWQHAERNPSVNPDEIVRRDQTISRTTRSINTLEAPADLPPAALSDDRDFSDNRINPRGLERSVSRRDEVEKTLGQVSQNSILSQIEPDVARSDQERIDRLRSDSGQSSSAFHSESPRSSNEWLSRMTNSFSFWKKTGLPNESQISSVFCDFDTTNQRLLDFELQSVKGRPVRFSQMPSELTLLFFWGTWCKPCHEAMPHLVELQRQLAADNVQIVGIAYEDGSAADRQKKVAMAADRYGINFPLLMGGSGGAESCPVRKAFDVRVYPTMVLMDRDGRVLWKDQGVTPASLGRLDRALASHLRELDSRQYARSDSERILR